ncbi:MAG TPA: sigma 54-interacting transcriptional regulator [Nevskia sp.]|nr:sigma 54-interacting transcriptional regulator [Nevskia sp.]
MGSKAEPTQTFDRRPPAFLTVVGQEVLRTDRDSLALLQKHVPEGQRFEFISPLERNAAEPLQSDYVLSLFVDPTQLDGIADKVYEARRNGRSSVLIVAIYTSQFVALGNWLDKRAQEGKLVGTRLMVGGDIAAIARQLPERMKPVAEDNVIRMPASAEIENSVYKNFYVFSPELQTLVARVRGFARNGVTRAILMGGPGSGKTTLAYYYYLVRGLGQWVSVNLAAENVGDKAAIKSLLCGHVSGAFPGAAARNGALTTARDGVCFMDESHEIAGAVMEVLMEVLDQGQYMPYGASAKRQMECALLYATNRSWAHLQSGVNLDEFTRLGAARLEVPELYRREEDMIAVVAGALARLAAPCKDWKAPSGISLESWKAMRDCRWHGNIRAVIRVLEAAFVDTASLTGDSLIQLPEIERGIEMWEPKTHHSHQIYAAA